MHGLFQAQHRYPPDATSLKFACARGATTSPRRRWTTGGGLTTSRCLFALRTREANLQLQSARKTHTNLKTTLTKSDFVRIRMNSNVQIQDVLTVQFTNLYENRSSPHRTRDKRARVQHIP